jgi:hypothetical protein
MIREAPPPHGLDAAEWAPIRDRVAGRIGSLSTDIAPALVPEVLRDLDHKGLEEVRREAEEVIARTWKKEWASVFHVYDLVKLAATNPDIIDASVLKRDATKIAYAAVETANPAALKRIFEVWNPTASDIQSLGQYMRDGLAFAAHSPDVYPENFKTCIALMCEGLRKNGGLFERTIPVPSWGFTPANFGRYVGVIAKSALTTQQKLSLLDTSTDLQVMRQSDKDLRGYPMDARSNAARRMLEGLRALGGAADAGELAAHLLKRYGKADIMGLFREPQPVDWKLVDEALFVAVGLRLIDTESANEVLKHLVKDSKGSAPRLLEP